MVIIGGGIIGCSIAYHLTLRGISDVVLLERKQLTCGTTWHAAGLVGQLRATHNLTRLAQYTAGLYAALEEEPARLRVSADGLARARRDAEPLRGAQARRLDGALLRPEVEVLSPVRLAICGRSSTATTGRGRHLPEGRADQPRRHHAGARQGARRAAAPASSRTPRSTAIIVERGRAVGVRTAPGDIAGRHRGQLRRACGSRELGARRAPACRCTRPSISISSPSRFPACRPICRSARPAMPAPISRRTRASCSSAGSSRSPSPGDMEGIPESFAFDQLPEDLGHIEPLLDAAIRRVPALGKAGVQLFFNGPESFTPDDRYLLGETPEVAQPVRGGRIQFDRDPIGGRRRQGARRLDRRRPPADGSLGRRHSSRHALPAQPPLPEATARSRHWGSSTRCTGRSGSRRRRAASAVPPCTIASAARRLLWGDGGLGTAELVRAGRRHTRIRIQLRPPELVRVLRARSIAPCARRSAYSTNPPSENSCSKAPTPKPCST